MSLGEILIKNKTMTKPLDLTPVVEFNAICRRVREHRMTNADLVRLLKEPDLVAKINEANERVKTMAKYNNNHDRDINN